MPLSDQERRCAEAVRSYLTEKTGRTWRVQDEWNADLETATPSFDTLLSDGGESLLVEITRLTDGPEFSRHNESVQSLYQSLLPGQAGRYCLYLPPPYVLRLDRSQVKQLKRWIKRAAVGLSVGDKVPVRVPKRGLLKFMREAKPGYIVCHHGSGWPLSEFSSETDGVYFLKDDWRYEHQFLTTDCRSEFERSVARVLPQSREQGEVQVEWQEEWELQRLGDSAEGNGGVVVIGFVADFEESAAIRSVHQGLEHGKGKLQRDSEGAKSAVALHAGEQQHTLSLRQYEDAIARLSASDVWPLDVVFLVDGDRVHRCFNYDHANAPLPTCCD